MAEKRKDNKGRNLKDGELQLADGRYKYQYTDRSGTRKAIYAWRLVPTDRAPAGARNDSCLREKEAEIERDKQDGIDGRLAGKVTLNDMFELYMSGKTELKQSTRANYKYMYKKFVTDTIGKKKLSAIKYSTIKAFYNSIINDKGVKPISMETINTMLHPVFTLAVRDGYIRSNPTDGIMAEIKKSHNWENPKRRALTEEQQAAFINFLAESEIYSHWLPLFTVFLGTGCRVGEIIGLRWCDCDFENGIISINHNLIYRQLEDGKCGMHITTPKTASGCRIIPMLDEVRRALLKERMQQMKAGGCTAEIDGYSDFVFMNKNRYVQNHIAINSAIERIRIACNEQEKEKAGKEKREPLIIPHFSVHNLRHTFCTRFCENETNIKVIQEIMGHSNISTTMNIYAEATESKKKEAFENLQGKIKIS